MGVSDELVGRAKLDVVFNGLSMVHTNAPAQQSRPQNVRNSSSELISAGNGKLRPASAPGVSPMPATWCAKALSFWSSVSGKTRPKSNGSGLRPGKVSTLSTAATGSRLHRWTIWKHGFTASEKRSRPKLPPGADGRKRAWVCGDHPGRGFSRPRGSPGAIRAIGHPAPSRRLQGGVCSRHPRARAGALRRRSGSGCSYFG